MKPTTLTHLMSAHELLAEIVKMQHTGLLAGYIQSMTCISVDSVQRLIRQAVIEETGLDPWAPKDAAEETDIIPSPDNALESL